MLILFQVAFTHDGLSQLWNELVRDGEITTNSNNGLINSAGVLSKKGISCCSRYENSLMHDTEVTFGFENEKFELKMF